MPSVNGNVTGNEALQKADILESDPPPGSLWLSGENDYTANQNLTYIYIERERARERDTSLFIYVHIYWEKN